MYKLLTRHGQSMAFGLGVLVTIIFLASIFSGLETFDGLSKEDQYQTSIFNFGIYASIGLVIICAISMVAFGVYQIASNFKNSIQGIAGFAVMIVIFLVARATAGADTGRLEAVKETFNVGPSQSSFISGAITTALVMLGIAALAFVVSEIRNFFK
jgi:hypothetical protein